MYWLPVWAEPQQAQPARVSADYPGWGPCILSYTVLSVCLSTDYGASYVTQSLNTDNSRRLQDLLYGWSGWRKYDHVSDVIDGLGWLMSVDSLHTYQLPFTDSAEENVGDL